MPIPFMHTRTETGEQLTVLIGGQHRTIPSDHANFTAMVDLAVATTTGTWSSDELTNVETELLRLADAGQTAVEAMRTLSERVSYQGGTLYFDGDPFEGPLADHIVTMLKSGDDNWSAPVAFLEKLASNPAKHVRKRLYQWISDRGLTLTPEGDVVGYKGVQTDDQNRSCHAGTETVWVNDVEHVGHIPNPVGAVVRMARSEVDNERDAPCSRGLHVGSWDYAEEFAMRTLIVTFNPRDVVAIPQDCEYQKIRVCRYVVQEVAERKLTGTTYTGPTTAEAELGLDDDDSEEWDAEGEDYDSAL